MNAEEARYLLIPASWRKITHEEAEGIIRLIDEQAACIRELEDKLQQCEQRNLSLSTLCRIVTSPWRRSDRPI